MSRRSSAGAVLSGGDQSIRAPAMEPPLFGVDRNGESPQDYNCEFGVARVQPTPSLCLSAT